MHCRHIARVFVIALTCATTVLASDLPAILRQAQESLGEEKYADAIADMERALPGAQGNAQLLAMLRTAYRGEIRPLVATGQRSEAQKYLDRLRLIEKESETTKAGDIVGRASSPVTEDNVKVIMPDSRSLPKVASQQPGWRPAKKPIVAEAASSTSAPAQDQAPSARVLSARPANEASKPGLRDAAEATKWIKQADALFLAGRYLEASELYDKANRLAPEPQKECQDRWAYCQLARIVDQINTQPENQQDWAAIRKELQSVMPLLPRKDFVRSLLAMANRHGETTIMASSSAEPVIRANEPDRVEPKETNLLAGLAARIGLGCSEDSAKRSLWQRFRSGPWHVLETSNFRVHATDENFAGQVADIAESTRIELYRTWYGHVPETNWSPKCDIFIHDSAEQYARITHQGQASPGHSQTGVDRGRITSRRIDLRRDGPDLIHAILPHEATHVVLADRFNAKPMPRWADEGMAVLTEPAEKKQAHLKNLGDLSQRTRLFTARQLMTMNDYPSGNQWQMFYAESVSLVEYLVNRNGPTKFIEFMEGSLASGYEGELKRVYGFASYDELDREWSRGRVEQVAAAMK